MNPIVRSVVISFSLGSVLLLTPAARAASGDSTTQLLAVLNSDDSIRGYESSKSWQVLFDAYLKMTPPPTPVGPRFNIKTIWPGMPNWSGVNQWAGANTHMAEAMIEAAQRAIVGLPYGCENVPATYSDAGLCVEINVEEGRREVVFHYHKALRTMAAYCTAEIYRRFEGGDIDGGLALMTSQWTVLRMFCDRQFMVEKLENIMLLTESLANGRDCFWTYFDQISPDQFREISLKEIPYLRPDRSRLLIPEADRIVAQAVLREVFDNETGDPIPDRFVEVFTRMQADRAPLTRLGAATRWRDIAMQHGGLEASEERLELIYDDWWRRWRLRQYGDLATLPSEFEKTNAMRYAGVLLSIENIKKLFAIRNNLRVAVWGTGLTAGLCAFKRETGTYPTPIDNKATRLYGTYVSKSLDTDPYYYRDDLNGLDGFRYRVLSQRTSLDVAGDRMWLDAGEALLYSIGGNEDDDLGAEHIGDGSESDLVVWPPVKVLLRQNGFLK